MRRQLDSECSRRGNAELRAMVQGSLLMITVEQLANLLREAERAHGEYESQLGHRDENWPDWYAQYMLPKLREILGRSSDA